MGIFTALAIGSPFTTVILNSTIANNSDLDANLTVDAGDNGAIGNGGGLMVKGTTQIINSTISNNSANYGGGIRVLRDDTTLDIVNSTITQNTAAGHGGGIQITNNPTVTLFNTILAGNTAGFSTSLDGFGRLDGNGSSYNLIGTLWDTTGFTNGVDGNQLNVADPGLALLGDYGGPTQTHALLAASPAIDAGSDSVALVYGLLEDQREKTRFADGDLGNFLSSDIGAFELGADEFFGVLGA